MSQKKQILRHLKEGKGISSLYALKHFGCFRLAARISEIRDDGFNIIPEWCSYEKKRFVRYTLIPW